MLINKSPISPVKPSLGQQMRKVLDVLRMLILEGLGVAGFPWMIPEPQWDQAEGTICRTSSEPTPLPGSFLPPLLPHFLLTFLGSTSIVNPHVKSPPFPSRICFWGTWSKTQLAVHFGEQI